MVNQFSDYILRLTQALDNIQEESIDYLYSQIKKRIDSKHSIHLIGNGGSAANASHIAGDFTKTFTMLGLKLNFISETDNSCYVTAASNDIDFSEVYSTLVGIKICSGDLIIYLSGSGNSINLVKCAQKAKKFGIDQIGILGYSGGRLKKILDKPIHIKINDMEISEDLQLIIFHYIKQRFCREYKNNNNNLISRKYDKRVIEDIVS